MQRTAKRQCYIIMDGQWGSCGKGLLAGYLAKENKPDVIVCNFGPNAGHTVWMQKGNDAAKKVMTQQLPTGIISRSAHTILIGPGAIINPHIFLSERDTYRGYLLNTEIFIHPRAAVVTQFDLDMEQISLVAIASTRKGVGAATANKAMRKPKPKGEPVVAADCEELIPFLITDARYRGIVRSANVLQIESAQGLELSINHGSHYPFCTSRDITPEAILNDVGVPMRRLDEIYVAMRTFPIRVGNEYKDGKEVGNSGPVYPDMDELTWKQVSAYVGEELEERTTVTNKVRRVFTWSDTQFERMLDIVGPCQIFINFMNYLDNITTGFIGSNAIAQRFYYHKNNIAESRNSRIALLGWGPSIDEVERIS